MLARLVGGPRVLAQTAATGPWSGALQRAGAMGAPRRWLSALPAGGAGAEPGEPSRPMRPSQEFSQDWKERVRRMNLQAISDKNRVIVPRGGTGREVSVREESLKGSVQKMNHLAKLVRSIALIHYLLLVFLACLLAAKKNSSRLTRMDNAREHRCARCVCRRP